MYFRHACAAKLHVLAGVVKVSSSALRVRHLDFCTGAMAVYFACYTCATKLRFSCWSCRSVFRVLHLCYKNVIFELELRKCANHLYCMACSATDPTIPSRQNMTACALQASINTLLMSDDALVTASTLRQPNIWPNRSDDACW